MARFEAILLGADGKAIAAKGLKWEVLRLDRRWQWYSRDGNWNYEADDAAPGAWPPARSMPPPTSRRRSRRASTGAAIAWR